MRVNQVVILTDFTRKEAGESFGHYSQGEIVSSYVNVLCESLEEENIKYYKQTSVETVMPNSLVLSCSAVWDEKPERLKANYSSVSYGQKSCRNIAEMFIDLSREWGKCYADLGHKTKESAKAKDELSKREDIMALRISPFCLNGPNSSEYARSSEIFGKMLAQCVYEFLAGRGELKRLPSMYR